jgi:hypothetical protein
MKINITSDHLKKIGGEVILSGFFGTTIVSLGHTWAPFASTSVLHGTLFAVTTSVASKAISYLTGSKIQGKAQTILSYTLGVTVSLIGSVGAFEMGITSSVVSLAGVILLTLGAAAADQIFKKAIIKNSTCLENKV